MMRLVPAWVLVNGLLLAPAWLVAALSEGPGAAWVSLEAAFVVALAALLAGRSWGRPAVWLTVLALVLATVVAFSDAVFRASLARPLNLSLDLYLLDAVYRLAVGNSGFLRTFLGAGLLVLALGLVTSLLAWLLVPGKRTETGRPSPRVAAGVLVGTVVLGLVTASTPALGRWVDAPLVRLARDQAVLFRETARERREFAAEIEDTPDGYRDVGGLLARLRGRDVVLAFIESYGMAAVEDPEFRASVAPRLADLAERVEREGLYLASGVLTSPTQGGQSWYAHGTVISGLWLDNQLRYELLLASDRETMVDDFRHAGWRTAALMPAITTAWPEGVRLGYDEIWTRPAIPYRGPPLYWVTMPDQFTWAFLGRTVHEARRAPDGHGDSPAASGGPAPMFVEAALVSSHAPWTPVLPVLPWDSVGDGSVFAAWRQEGHPPEELWVDIGELRTGYAASIAYSLETMTGFAERWVDERMLLVVIGDHQAAPWVTGATSSAVPIHVISGDPDLLEPFLAWGLRPGAFPETRDAPPRMDAFRDWFVHAFSGAPASPTGDDP